MGWFTLWLTATGTFLVLNHFFWRNIKMSNTVEIYCRIVHETESAFLIDAGTDTEVWIPKSQVTHVEPQPDDKHVEIHMSEWIASQKDLI